MFENFSKRRHYQSLSSRTHSNWQARTGAFLCGLLALCFVTRNAFGNGASIHASEISSESATFQDFDPAGVNNVNQSYQIPEHGGGPTGGVVFGTGSSNTGSVTFGGGLDVSLDGNHAGWIYGSESDAGTWSFSNTSPPKYGPMGAHTSGVITVSGFVAPNDTVNVSASIGFSGPTGFPYIVLAAGFSGAVSEVVDGGQSGRQFSFSAPAKFDWVAFGPTVFGQYSVVVNQAMGITRHAPSSGLNVSALDSLSTYGTCDISLSTNVLPALPGDYNGDGTVDAADYTVWRNSLGQSVAAGIGADGTGPGGVPDGVIDRLDFDFWNANYGQSAGAGSLADRPSVPEPASLAMLAFGVFATVIPARNRSSKKSTKRINPTITADDDRGSL